MSVEKPLDNRRRYVRLRTILPIDFSIVHLEGELAPGIGWEKGHTENASKGGLCLEANLKKSTINYLNQSNILLDMRINFPNAKEPIKVIGHVAWFSKKDQSEEKFLIGVQYRSITSKNIDRILLQSSRYQVLFYLLFFSLALFVLFFLMIR